MKKVILSLIFTALLTVACDSQKQGSTASDTDTLALTVEGDSSLYGLVCYGSTDTLLVLLPSNNIGAYPDTFNILNASRRHQVFGTLNIGDIVAVVRNEEDSTVADIVIDIENLEQTWLYDVMPTLHRRADMVGRTEQQILSNLPDSIRTLLTISKQYTLQLNNDHSVLSLSSVKPSENENAIVEYPAVKRYRQWHLYNGQLLLTEMMNDSLGAMRITSQDTADFVMLNADTLVLRFQNAGETDEPLRSYYPKRVHF